MTTALILLKQIIERIHLKAGWRFWLYVLIVVAVVWIALVSLGCAGTTYTNIKRLEIDWKGNVTSVEGGSSTSTSPFADIGHLTSSLTWLLAVGGVVLLIVAWKVPGWLQRRKESKAERRPDPPASHPLSR